MFGSANLLRVHHLTVHPAVHLQVPQVSGHHHPGNRNRFNKVVQIAKSVNGQFRMVVVVSHRVAPFGNLLRLNANLHRHLLTRHLHRVGRTALRHTVGVAEVEVMVVVLMTIASIQNVAVDDLRMVLHEGLRRATVQDRVEPHHITVDRKSRSVNHQSIQVTWSTWKTGWTTSSGTLDLPVTVPGVGLF